MKDNLLVVQVQDRFDVVVTIDRGFEYEHNLKNLRFGVVIVQVPKNKLDFYRSLRSQLREAVEQVKPGFVVHVQSRKKL